MKKSQSTIIKIGVVITICLLSVGIPLRVLADATPPTVLITFPAPDGINGWYKTSPVSGTVTVNDNNIVASINCSGDGLVSDAPTGIGTTSATMNISITGDGARTISCTAWDDTTYSTSSQEIKIDATGPSVNFTINGTLGNNGWYVSDVTAVASGTDISTPVTCTAIPSLTTDTDGTAFNSTCTNAAGVSTNANSELIKRDATKPSNLSGAPERYPDSNGWYNSPFIVKFNATDNGSGIDTCTNPYFEGPDGTGLTVTGTCQDLAGNISDQASSNPFNYDATAPGISFISYNPPTTGDGWNNTDVTVSWSCSDATPGSGVDTGSSTTSQSMSSEGIQSAIGICMDYAGNKTEDPRSVKIDKTKPYNVSGSPERAPDQNGWYNAPVSIKFTGVDDLSGIRSCSSILYNSSDGQNLTVNGNCTDAAGNASDTVPSIPFDYDNTGPNVTITPVRPADHNGWYNKLLSFSINGIDNLSGVETCASVPDYSGPDGTNIQIIGSCDDVAGNATSKTVLINFDSTAPNGITGVPERAPDKNDWYNHPVNIVFAGNDSVSGIDTDGCTKTLFTGPDSITASVKGSCTDKAGNKSLSVDSNTFKYDTTRPIAKGNIPSSPYGWFNTNVVVTFTGTDSLSGIDTCSDPVTVTTEGSNQSAIGFCKDLAGNLSLVASAGNINIDKTPPITTYIGRAPAPDKNGWNYSPVTVGWKCTDALSGIVFSPITVEITSEGKNLSATGTCQDRAGNTSNNTVSGINITFTLPTATATPSPVPSSTSTIPPTATETLVPPTSTPTPTLTPTQTLSSFVPVASEAAAPTNQSSSPSWYFILGGIIVAVLIIGLIVYLLNKKK